MLNLSILKSSWAYCKFNWYMKSFQVHNPGNTQSIELQFRGEKTAKVVGKLAMQPPEDGQILSGVLVRRNFNYHLMHPSDLSGEHPVEWFIDLIQNLRRKLSNRSFPLAVLFLN